jgi:hypothetical protein
MGGRGVAVPALGGGDVEGVDGAYEIVHVHHIHLAEVPEVVLALELLGRLAHSLIVLGDWWGRGG